MFYLIFFCPALYDRRDIMFLGCPSVHPSHFTGTALCAAPSKRCAFQQIIMYVLQCPHDVDVHLIFCFALDLHITCSQGRVNIDFLHRSSLMGTILRAAPNKSYAI